MKNLIIFILAFIMLIPGVCSFASEKKVEDTIIKTGNSDRDIMPFLETSVLKWGKYFSKIYGECNEDNITVRMDASGRYVTFKEIERASYAFAKELALTYPLYTAKVTVFPSDLEKSWRVICWEIENGKVIAYQEN